MAILRTYAEVLEQEPNAAETKLVEKCKAGEQCILGDGTCPTAPDPTRTIRADILRYLLLGGCADCVVDGRGVWLIGGYIGGTLDLNYATVKGATQLPNCCFENQIDSVQTHFGMVNLVGSTLAGWRGERANVEGSVFLRNVNSSSTISILGATIGGQLACDGATLAAKGDYALIVASAKVEGSIFLNSIIASATIILTSATIGGQLSCNGAQITTAEDDAIIAANAQISGGVLLHPRTQKDKAEVKTPFHATGELRFNGATLGGVYAQSVTLVATGSGQTLSLGGATIDGPVRLDGCDSTGEILLAGSRISGRLTCERIKIRNEKGHAFNGQAMRVEHSFVWKKVDHTSGGVSLNGAHVAELNDDPENWPETEDLFLDGFTYDRIKGTVSISPARMGWLKSGSFFEDDFRPQPYSQYAKFLRDTGHDEESRRVLFTRERLRRASARDQLRGSNTWFAEPRILWSAIWDILLRYVVGYGHHPFRSVFVLAALICATIVPAHYAWEEGSFAPNAAPVLVSDSWLKIAQSDPRPAAVWAGDRLPVGATDTTLTDWKAIAPGRDWETFNRYAYGFDVVIPIIDFGQTDAWAPSTTRGDWGKVLWVARWVLSVMGWIVTALGAAAITGIIRWE
ncbi:MAG: hypothetical protein AAF252_11710 [Pseudomonadota bacterium]